MYRLNSGIKVVPYDELKENVNKLLLNLFLETHHKNLNLENRIYLESKT